MPDRAELIPIQRPHLQYPNIGVRDSLITALHNRPEINQSLKEIRAACVREQIATKDLLPVLDAVLATYVSGLEGDGRMGQAWVDQFSVGEPAYTAGLQFELPLGNRSAKARLYKRQLEIQQFSLQLKQTVAVVVEEIEVAVRDVDAAYREVQAQYLAMKAANTEIKYLERTLAIVAQRRTSSRHRSGRFARRAGTLRKRGNQLRFGASGLQYITGELEPRHRNPLEMSARIFSRRTSPAAKSGNEEIPMPPSEVYRRRSASAISGYYIFQPLPQAGLRQTIFLYNLVRISDRTAGIVGKSQSELLPAEKDRRRKAV